MVLHKVLFVCEANICRSPLLAFRFARAMEKSGLGETFVVSDRGTLAKRSNPICEVVQARIAEDNLGVTFAENHRSKSISRTAVAAQDLIIVSGRAERSVVAQLNPDARSHTFTLLEALELGRHGFTPERVQTMNPQANRPLRDLAHLLADRRGTLPLWEVEARPSRLPWKRGVHNDPLDVPDVHHMSSGPHTKGLRELDAEIDELSDLVVRFLSAHPGV